MQSTDVTKNSKNDQIKKLILRILILCTGLSFVIVGLFSDGFKDVMAKAIRICLECIGIG